MVGSSPEESGGHTCRLTTESKLEGNTTGGLSRTIPSGMHMNHKNDPHFPQFAGLSVTLGSSPAHLSLSLSLSLSHTHTNAPLSSMAGREMPSSSVTPTTLLHSWVDR